MQFTVYHNPKCGTSRNVLAAIREAGHECTWIPDGAVAVDTDALLANDIVVLDLMLPKVSGLDVLRAARSRGIRTPVIVLTARGTVPDKLEGFQAGADDYLVKPFEMDELLARIEAVHRRTSDRPAMRPIRRMLRAVPGSNSVRSRVRYRITGSASCITQSA